MRLRLRLRRRRAPRKRELPLTVLVPHYQQVVELFVIVLILLRKPFNLQGITTIHSSLRRKFHPLRVKLICHFRRIYRQSVSSYELWNSRLVWLDRRRLRVSYETRSISSSNRACSHCHTILVCKRQAFYQL